MPIVRDPVYLQLAQVLKEKANELPDGEKFLTEREIAQQFNVSRATANKALAALVAEGILLFRKGVGTFVCHQRLRYDLGELVSFTARAIAAGHTPTTEVILWEPDLDPVELPPWCQQIWEPAEPFHYLERLRKSDGTPVIYEERCLNATLCKANAMPPEKLGTSLYSLIAKELNLTPARYRQVLRAALLPERLREPLECGTHEAVPALVVYGVAFHENGQWIWIERTWYRPEYGEFCHELERHGNGTPARAMFRETEANKSKDHR